MHPRGTLQVSAKLKAVSPILENFFLFREVPSNQFQLRTQIPYKLENLSCNFSDITGQAPH